jgi:methyltransferase (TIGR00027 family)
MVAAARAFGAREPDESVRNPDWLAERLLGPEELELIEGHPLSRALDHFEHASQDFQVAGIVVMMQVRTRYIDEKLAHALQNGASQVVILGAGFDTRPYRLEELLKGKRVFEVDSPPTQARKRQRVEAVLGHVPENLVYVPVDFNKDKLGDVLREAGYRASEKTFFIWEGVSMYLPEERVRETLGAIATESAPGSSLVMDYASRGALEFMTKYPEFSPSKMLEAWGERWMFGVPDGQEKPFFAEAGLDTAELLSVYGAESVKRYLTRRDGTTLGMRPGAARPTLPPEVMAAAIEIGKRSVWYALAELTVPINA